MSKPTITSDPTYYRVEYSRIAQGLHELTAVHREGTARSVSLWDDEVVAAAVRLVNPETPFEQEHVVDVISARPEPLSVEPRALIAATRRELVRLGWRWAGRTPPWYVRRLRRVRPAEHRLAIFLDEVLEPATVVLYFSCRIEEGAKWEINASDLSQPRERALDRRAATDRSPDAVSDRWLLEYLTDLIGPLPAPPSGLKRAAAWAGVARWRRPSEPNYRVRYNLACLFSRRARTSPPDKAGLYLELARLQLDLCLSQLGGSRRRAVVEWAEHDPGLAELRQRLV
jgi:hypothetical protein